MSEMTQDAQIKGLIEIRSEVVVTGHPLSILHWCLMLSDTKEQVVDSLGCREYELVRDCVDVGNKWN